MNTTLRKVTLGLLLATLLVSPAVLASGFHIYEQGAKASGQAVAFTARADDATANWYNPANIARFENSWVSVGFSAVFLGDTTFVSSMDSIDPGLFDGGSFDMVDNTGLPVHFYYTRPMGELWGKKVALGASVTTPFGLVSEWDLPFDGRFSGRKADLQTLVLNVNGAMDFGNGWSAAFGLDYLDADLKDFSSNSFSLLVLGYPYEPISNLTGTGNDVGWNAALSWQNDEWAFGMAYRTGFELKLDGRVSFSEVPTPFASFFPNSPASGTMDLPATMSLGMAYTGLDKWEFEADLHKINWNSFSELRIDFENPLLGDQVVNEDWKSTVSYRFGGSYDLSEKNQLRFGSYVETTAIPVRSLRASIPDADRMGYSLGYGYSGSRFSIDVYVMHIETQKATAGLTEYVQDSTVAAGSYETSIDLIGVTASFKL